MLNERIEALLEGSTWWLSGRTNRYEQRRGCPCKLRGAARTDSLAEPLKGGSVSDKGSRGLRVRRNGIRRAADHTESVAAPPEELLKILQPRSATLE